MNALRIRVEQRAEHLWRDISVTHLVACAYVSGDDRPLVEMPLKRMAEWLTEQGYRYCTGSNGVWQRQEAA